MRQSPPTSHRRPTGPRTRPPTPPPGGPSVTCGEPDDHGWQLIARTRAGDSEAFGQFYDRYFTDIYRYVISLVRNQQTAEYLTAETFFRALRAVATVRPELNSPRGWLFTIARNVMREHGRLCEVRRTSPTAEIAEELDRTRIPVAALHHRAIQRLRAIVQVDAARPDPSEKRDNSR